ncbi:ATP-grasp domain-containing protein [Kitasatospora sp. NPDC096147]|uniref:ATP-grasp domain-containing protein n=1 Tax=Kitasatospora sp. NPDC096147 TaxID=3364093 RepID=UPI00382BAEC8
MSVHPPAPAGRVLIVEPSSSGLALLDKARALGFEVVVATADRDDRRLPETARASADQLLVVDTNDEAALLAAVADLHAERPFTGLVPGFEFYVDTTARLAAALGLPGLRAEIADGLRNKARMRTLVEAAGLRVPRFAEVRDEDGLTAAAAHVGFPAVLKPTESAGSIHVSRVEDLGQLLAAYRHLRADTRTDLGRDLAGPVLLEEYLDGPEISVEGYVEDGWTVVLAVTTKMLGPEPYFVELGQVMPRDCDLVTRAAIEKYVAGVCKALGVVRGPFHCELRLPGGEPVLIELGARLAGHRIPTLVEAVTGVDQVGVMVGAYTGLDSRQVGAHGAPSAKYVGIACFTEYGLTRYDRIEGIEELRAHPDTLDVQVYLPAGEEIPPAEDFRCFLGHVVYRAESYEEAVERWHAVRNEVRFVQS